MLRAWLVKGTGDYTDSASLDLRPRFATSQLATSVRTASTANNPAATTRTALNGIFRRRQFAEQDHRHVGDQHPYRGSRDDLREIVEACGDHDRRDLGLVPDLGQEKRDHAYVNCTLPSPAGAYSQRRFAGDRTALSSDRRQRLPTGAVRREGCRARGC